ncbi:pilus assembly protein TadG-related protein [Sphingomonas sp. G124]|uniref:Pilus assembly protein TadG-related protein n=1 Tax=Sphingomonas cremea TaxID=2904799 RepID=A0A9X1QMN1_9SPHN|nr:pilus assembly protein TadG-related protein [Sphingomonas cremea]MCF2514817.1 pilus assembly protein TadG-related protein [Sphingomonas cremea]
MMRRLFDIWGDKSAAVAPTVALSMLALIGAGGIAFDYARLATLDTELQQAADQSALAAATQLDRADGARERARDAITSDDKDRLAENLTRFANDSDADGTAVEIETITFCSEFDDSIQDNAAACEEVADGDAAGDSESRYVIVTTKVRAANYALTPIVGAFAGDVSATAVAGIESSICNVAPLLVCAPSDDFPTPEDVGKGIVMKTAGGNAWAPGNYGFLDFGNGNPAVLNALLGNGLNGCQNTDDNETEPGNKNATDAINTRMDVYAGSNKNDASNCVPSTGVACPAQDTRKDMTQDMTFEVRLSSTAAQPAGPNCGAAAGGNVNSGGKTSYASDFAQNGAARQFGRDTCHYTGSCPTAGGAQNFGDGNWDRAGYIAANHPGETAATIAAAIGGGASAGTLTRYQVYQWEIANMGSGKLDPLQIGTADVSSKLQGGNRTWTIVKKCAFNKPRFATVAATTVKDRRVLPIVAANCDNLKGKGSAFEDYVILRVFDIFLTEPSLQRTQAQVPGATISPVTDDKEIYGEVIGPAQPVGGSGGFQYYSRSRPYLVR